MLFPKRLFIVLGVVIAAISCGGGGPLTVEEYSRTICPGTGAQAEAGQTWGDTVRMLEEWRQLYDVTPPAALRAYHQANIAVVDAMLDFATEQPAREPVEFDGSIDLWMAAQPPTEKLEQTVENMNPELLAVLAEHGC